VVGHSRDVSAVVGHDLDEGPGQDGPDGLGDRNRTGAGGLTHPLLASQPCLVDADDHGGVDPGPAAADEVGQGVGPIGGGGFSPVLGVGLFEHPVGLGGHGGVHAGPHRGGGLALVAVGTVVVGPGAMEALGVDALVAGSFLLC
jgi:hypothetical protein